MERIPSELEKLEGVLPAMVIEIVRSQIKRIERLDKGIAEIEEKLSAWKKEDAASKKLMEIPRVVLTATAAVATIGDAKAFKPGREFAAFVGLVSRQSGTGGRVKLLARIFHELRSADQPEGALLLVFEAK